MSNKKRRMAEQTRIVLAERFPLCFVPQGTSTPKKALKLGIHRDILAACQDLSKESVNAALYDYTRGFKYADALKAGAPRIDLNGNPCGTVSADYADIEAAKAVARSLVQSAIQRLENENLTLRLFCCHVRKSDERIACSDYASALELADLLNKQDASMAAVPAPWAGSCDEHRIALHCGQKQSEAA